MNRSPAHQAHRRSVRYCRASTRPAEVPRNQILLGDAVTMLAGLPEASVDTVITSPPYFLLRTYNVEGQLGQEATVNDWVTELVAVCDQLARVLKPTGSLWLNVGDSFSRHARLGAPPKSLLLGPERLLLALAGRGWLVRSKVIWFKPNPMPSSVTDRLSNTYEVVYFLTRSPRYFFDLDRIRIPHLSRPGPRRTKRADKYESNRAAWAGPFAGRNDGLEQAKREGRPGHRLGKNPGDVWEIATGAYRGAHFATFPERLITRPLLATCPERTCRTCGEPWTPTETGPVQDCPCPPHWQPGLVLDPFMGSGTVAVTAEHHDRDWLGIELNPTYRHLALDGIHAARTTGTSSLDPTKEVTPTTKGDHQ